MRRTHENQASVCAECGELVVGTCDPVPGTALVNQLDDGTFEYAGDTKMLWDSQRVEEDPEGKLVKVACHNGHEWYAAI